ncbi:MAG: hypothetical protein A4E69_00317 [Syntrophus sp. PtaB.Bin138]|nr:MAG: hypothetical protein A4E69_00317 [Syntrophus sp. PtaB.Bin138]
MTYPLLSGRVKALNRTAASPAPSAAVFVSTLLLLLITIMRSIFLILSYILFAFCILLPISASGKINNINFPQDIESSPALNSDMQTTSSSSLLSEEERREIGRRIAERLYGPEEATSPAYHSRQAGMNIPYLIICFIITWSVGLFPPVLIRYVFLKRAMKLIPAVFTCTAFWIVNILVFTALGGDRSAVLILIAIVSCMILRSGPTSSKTP